MTAAAFALYPPRFKSPHWIKKNTPARTCGNASAGDRENFVSLWNLTSSGPLPIGDTLKANQAPHQKMHHWRAGVCRDGQFSKVGFWCGGKPRRLVLIPLVSLHPGRFQHLSNNTLGPGPRGRQNANPHAPSNCRRRHQKTCKLGICP